MNISWFSNVCYVCSVIQLCPTLCDPTDCSLPWSSVKARILEWVAISSSRGSSWPKDQTCICCISCIGRQIFFFFFFTTEPPGNRYWGYYNEWTHKLFPPANPTITPTYLKLNVLVCGDRQWTGKRIQKQGDVGEGLSREGGQARLVRWRLSLNLKDEKNKLSVVLGEWHFGQREQVQRSCGRYAWGAKDISLGWILVSEQGEWNERRERQQRPGLVGSW